MYVLLIKNSQKGVDFTYGDDINYYYVFKLLRGLYVDLIRKKSKVKKFSLDTIRDLPDETKIDIEKKYQLIQKELNKQHWYDKKVFEIIESGVSIAELERKSKIGYFRLRNTYNKVKQKLISLI
jgi:phage-related protein